MEFSNSNCLCACCKLEPKSPMFFKAEPVLAAFSSIKEEILNIDSLACFIIKKLYELYPDSPDKGDAASGTIEKTDYRVDYCYKRVYYLDVTHVDADTNEDLGGHTHEAKEDGIFLNSLAFSMIHWMLAV